MERETTNEHYGHLIRHRRSALTPEAEHASDLEFAVQLVNN
jgi:hypothetical protein